MPTISSRITTLFIALILLVAPLKFGAVIDAAGIGFYPLSLLEWVFMSWPPLLTAPLSSIALGLAVLAARGRLPSAALARYKHLILPSMGLLIAAGIASVMTTEKEYALRFLWHLLAIVNFSLAIAIHLFYFPASQRILLAAIVLGTILSTGSGLYQIMYGFNETKDAAYELARQQQQALSPQMLSRLNQTRAFASFTYPNIYAAHLILTLPITLMCVWSVSAAVSPPFLSQLVFTGAGAILSLTVLSATGSRGAVIAIILAGIIVAILRWQPIKGAWQHQRSRVVMVGGLTLVLGGVMLHAVSQGRTLLSLFARMDYYTTACEIFLQQPIMGVGMGEFFPYYLRFKPPDAEETRLAHNILFHFLSQSGLVGGSAAIYFLAQPFILFHLAVKKIITPISLPLFNAALLGVVAWNLHALTDFNEQIPGTMLVLTTLPLLMIKWKLPESATNNTTPAGIYILLSGLILLGFMPVTRLAGERAYQQLYLLAQKPVDLNQLKNAAVTTARLMPLSPYPWDLLGKAALRHNDDLLAAQAYREAIARAPHRAPYHAYLAQSFFASGDIAAARDSMRNALKWYPHQKEFQKFYQQLQGMPK